MKKGICVILCVVMLFSFSSCDALKNIFRGEVSRSFSYSVEDMPDTIDPQVANDEAALIIVENCMEGLVRTDSNGKIIPGIAKSWTISDDAKTYTFNLRDDAVWYVSDENKEVVGNGFKNSITAADFVFAVKRAVDSSTASPDFQSVAAIKNAVKINTSGSTDFSSLGISAKDDYTLVITLENSDKGFLSTLTNAVFMPCNEQFFEACAGRYGKSAEYFLSNAGFKLSLWAEDNIVFNKNEEYKGANPAKGDSVTIYEDENAFANFKGGNYDALAVSFDNVKDVIDDESLEIQKYDDTVWALIINSNSSFGKEKGFAQALMMSFDYSAVPAPKWAKTAGGLIPNICTASGKNYRDSAGGAGAIKADFTKGYDKYISAVRAAAENNEKLKDDEGNAVCSVKFLCTSEFDNASKIIVQNWQKNFGTSFNAKISVKTLEQLRKSVEDGEYDIALFPISADTQSALIFMQKFSTEENIIGFSSPSFRKIINSSADEVTKCLNAEKELINSGYIRPLYSSDSYYVQRREVKNIYFYAFGGKVNFLNAERVK